MSHGGNARRSELLEVARILSVRAAGELQHADLRVDDARALLQLWFLLFHDVLGLSVQDLQTEVGRFARSMRGWAWVDVVKVLKALDNALLHLEGDITCYTSFKHSYSQFVKPTTTDGRQPLWLPSALMSTLFLGVKDQDPFAVRRGHQVLQFPLRGDIITDRAREELAQDGITRFVECEARLQNHCLPDDTAWNPFFQIYLGEWDPWQDLVCRISSGSALVNGRGTRRWWEKWSRLDIANREYIEWFAGKVFPVSSDRCADDTAKFFQVPKSSDALRGISIEPAGLAYLQQGLMRSLRRYIRMHPYLHRRFDPLHPELSADLAKEGSLTGKFATIDLSEASDSVMLEYLERVACETDFLEAILLARSPYIAIGDERRLPLVKYGGMGNALTFSIESLVFASLIEQGIRDVRGSVPRSRYRVYGDDLVVEEEYYTPVCERLTTAGFIVNASKSFSSASGSPFRESCGGEYFKGVDVKPVRVPRKQFRRISRHMPAESIQGYIELANSSFGVLPTVRWAIITQLFEALPQHLWPRFSRDGSVGLRSDQPTNFRLVRKELGPASKKARDWQYSTKVLYGDIRAKTDVADLPDEVRYEHCLLGLAGRDCNDTPLTIDEQLALQAQCDSAAHLGDSWGVTCYYE